MINLEHDLQRGVDRERTRASTGGSIVDDDDVGDDVEEVDDDVDDDVMNWRVTWEHWRRRDVRAERRERRTVSSRSDWGVL